MKPSPNSRTQLFGAAMFFAGALGSWHVRSEGEDTGVLRFGGRNLQVINRNVDPESFSTWSNYFGVTIFVCVLAGMLCLWLAWKLKKPCRL